MSKFFRVAALLTLLGLSSLTVAPSGAVAASPSQEQCEASGGTFIRDHGQVSCIYESSEHLGNSEHSQTVDTTTTESSNGTLNNKPKHEEDESCNGPGGSTDKSAHCK